MVEKHPNDISEEKVRLLRAGFKQYLNSEVVQKTYQKLCGVPDENCLHCNKLVHCGGGCVCQYTNYKLKDYLVKQNEAQE